MNNFKVSKYYQTDQKMVDHQFSIRFCQCINKCMRNEPQGTFINDEMKIKDCLITTLGSDSFKSNSKVALNIPTYRGIKSSISVFAFSFGLEKLRNWFTQIGGCLLQPISNHNRINTSIIKLSFAIRKRVRPDKAIIKNSIIRHYNSYKREQVLCI